MTTGVKVFSTATTEDINEFIDTWLERNPDKRIVFHHLIRLNKHDQTGDRMAVSIQWESIDVQQKGR